MTGSQGLEAAEFEISRLRAALDRVSEEAARLEAIWKAAGWDQGMPPLTKEAVLELKEQRDHYYRACTSMAYEIDQTLGRALGMVLTEADRPELIGAQVGDVFTGTNTPETLADLAAKIIQELEEENRRLRDMLAAKG